MKSISTRLFLHTVGGELLLKTDSFPLPDVCRGVGRKAQYLLVSIGPPQLQQRDEVQAAAHQELNVKQTIFNQNQAS